MTMRMLAVYAIAVPLVLAILPGVLMRDVVLLVAMPAGVVVAVIVAAIAFASWRIEGNGLVYAREEHQ
jgi:hypothetical protein